MSSLRPDPETAGAWRIQYQGLASGRPMTLRLGKVTKKAALSFQAHFDRLCEARRMGASLDPSLAEWIKGLPAKMHGKLVVHGLAAGRADTVTLGDFLDRFIAARADVKPETTGSYDRARQSLLAYFDRGRSPRSRRPRRPPGGSG